MQLILFQKVDVQGTFLGRDLCSSNLLRVRLPKESTKSSHFVRSLFTGDSTVCFIISYNPSDKVDKQHQ